MDSTKQLDLVSLLLKSADEKKYSRDSMPKDVRNHWARQAVREENGAYSPRTQRRLLESFMNSPYSEEKEDIHPHSEDLRAELSSRPESYYHKDSLRGARKLLASAKETLKAGRNHIAENKFLYRTAAQMVGMAGLAGAAKYGSGVAAKAIHNKIKSHIEARNAPKELSLGGKVKKGLSELEKVVKHNPKLAAGLGAGALVAGGAGVAIHEHHKKAGVNPLPLFDEEWHRRNKLARMSEDISDSLFLGAAATAGVGAGWLGGRAHDKNASLEKVAVSDADYRAAKKHLRKTHGNDKDFDKAFDEIVRLHKKLVRGGVAVGVGTLGAAGMGAYGIDRYVKSHEHEEHSKQASLKQLLSHALHTDEFEKTAEATRFLMPVEKRAELFTDFVNKGFSVKEAADKVDSIELAFTKMGGTSMEVFKPVVNVAKDAGEAVGNAAGNIADKAKSAFSDARDKVVGSVKANPLKWTGGALGAGAVGGYAAHSSNKGTTNQ